MLWIPACAGMTKDRLGEPHSTKIAIDPFFPSTTHCKKISFNPETVVGREKAVQEIYVHRELQKRVVTFWVMRAFYNSLGA